MGRAIGGTEFVRCTEIVRLSESPLLEVSLYVIQAGGLALLAQWPDIQPLVLGFSADLL